MEVILTEDVPNLGHIGSVVKVAAGYGRNFLLPKKMAIVASTHNKRQFEHEKRLVGFRRAKAVAESEQMVKKLGSLTVRLARKVGEQDKLFGSVTTHDVQEELSKLGITVDRRKLELREPIKALGEYTIPVRLPGDVKAAVKVVVVAE